MADSPRSIDPDLQMDAARILALPKLAQVPAIRRHPVHVLVMDESLDLLDFYGAILLDEGLTSTMTTTLLTVDQVRSVHPDVIVMEAVFQNELRGYCLISELQRDTNLRSIPVVCCTALRPTEIPATATAVKTVFKPFDIQELLSAIDESAAIAPPENP